MLILSIQLIYIKWQKGKTKLLGWREEDKREKDKLVFWKELFGGKELNRHLCMIDCLPINNKHTEGDGVALFSFSSPSDNKQTVHSVWGRERRSRTPSLSQQALSHRLLSVALVFKIICLLSSVNLFLFSFLWSISSPRRTSWFPCLITAFIIVLLSSVPLLLECISPLLPAPKVKVKFESTTTSIFERFKSGNQKIFRWNHTNKPTRSST